MGNKSHEFKCKQIRPLRPMTERFSTYLLWGSLVGVAFFSVYPTTNWITGLGGRHYLLYFPDELRLPFFPSFIWLYLSMYILMTLPPFFLNPAELKRLAKILIAATFLSGIVFLLLPAKLGFSRVLPVDGLYRTLFQWLFIVDQPYNLVPSLHVVYSTAICLAIIAHVRGVTQILVSIWLVLIVISTSLVHQHHLLDIVSGVVLAILMTNFWERKNA